MSNKIVSGVYTAIIKDVIDSLKTDFDEFGIGDEVLATLHEKWHQRVVAARVADFTEPQNNAYNQHAAQFTGMGANAANGLSVSRTSSPNINRTNSPAQMPHSRGASRTNSIGASSMNQNGSYNQASASYPSSQGSNNSNNVTVKSEPQDRFMPGPTPPGVNPAAAAAQAGAYPGYNPAMHLQMAQGMGMGGVPPLNNFALPNMNALNAYGANRGIPGYGGGPNPGAAGGGLMLPRNAAPYGAAAAAGNTSGPSKVPQMDGAWDQDSDATDETARRKRREFMVKKYPWMANAQLQSLDGIIQDQIPQVDGPTPSATPAIPPLNILPPLNLPSSSSSGGITRAGGPPPLTLPPLNLPADLANAGNRAIHPSLMNRDKSSEDVIMKRDDIKKEDPDIKRPPLVAPATTGSSSSFARNPNVPALASEDITSDLDDSDEEEGPHEQPGSDPSADVTYCTYDKVTRVKTKWKVVFRDGMVHANGKDYLFGRCTGEFDW